MNQKELYERQVSENDTSQGAISSPGPRETALLKWISGQVENSKKSSRIRIAELSVGDGQLSRALAQALLNALIDGVDISSRRLEYCRAINRTLPEAVAERIRFLELNLDTEFNRLEQDSYDVVLGIDVLEHVFDPFAFVGHCARILKTGGVLFLRVPNLAYVKRRLALLGGKLPVTSSWFETPGSFQSWKDRHGWDGGHLHFFTIEALGWLLAGEGFDNLSWGDVGAKGEAVRRLWPGMLFGNLAVSARKMS